MQLLQLHEPGETPLPHEDTVAVGIDLGTTYSVVAVAREDGVDVLHNIHGHALVPSVVHYGDDAIEVGFSALKKFHAGAKNTYASIKRIMGRGVDDKLAVAVSSEILKHLKHNAEQALGKEVTKAVITVPAYFDDAARQATKDAAKIAGLEVLRLVNEPTAAALAYGLDTGAEGIYAIYDLGGGTFDVSLLKMQQGVFQVLATGGDTQLGGDDFDQAITAWLIAQMGLTNPTPEEMATLLGEAREAKHGLTDTTSFIIKDITLTREIFEELILDYVEKTIAVCEQAIGDANLTLADIKGVVMVGGSTRVPLVIQKVREFFGREPLVDLNPDEVVALGAAIQARGLTHGSGNLLLDVIPLSLGLETMGGLTEKLIYRNTPIPVTMAQEFTTHQDGQQGMIIHIVQGEREMVAHNRSLGKFELSGIPPLPAGIARVEVTFNVDADGLLTVAAREKTTGTEQKIQVKPSYGLPPEQIEKMLYESMEKAQSDITERLLVEARVEAERTIIEIESAIKTDGDLLSDAERKVIDRQIKTVRNAASGADRDYIDAETHELARITQDFAERRMDKAIGGALKGVEINKVMSGEG